MTINFEADAAGLGIDVERYKKARRSLMAFMTRRRTRKITPTEYECIAGPFAGAFIWLETGQTGIISVNGERGRYSPTALHGEGYHHQRRHAAKPCLLWGAA